MLAAGCGGAANGPSSTPTTMVFASNQEPAGLDPISANSVNSLDIDAQIFDNLVYLASDLKPVPGLATSWTSTPDDKTYTLQLKHGVQFSNGKPLNAQTLVQYFNLLISPPKGLVLGGSTAPVAAYLQSVKALGSYAIQISLKQPVPDFMTMLTDPGLGIPYPAAVAADPKGFGQNPIGSGPYTFVNWQHGNSVTLKANPNYHWGSQQFFGTTGPAKIKTLVYRFIPNSQSRLDALRSGQVQFVDLLPFSEVTSVRKDTHFQVQGYIIPGLPQMNYMNISVAPTNDINVRRAVEYAVNKNAIIKDVYFGMTVPAYGPLSKVFPEFNPALESMYSFDPAKAEQILAADGWKVGANGVRYKNGKPLSVVVVENKGWNQWVYLMQSELNAVGFNATVLTTEGASNTAAIASCKYALPAMGDVFASASQMGRDWIWTPTNKPAYDGMCGEDPTLNAMIQNATTELNPAVRTQDWKNVQTYIMQKAYEVPIFELEFYTAFAKNLTGFKVDGTGYYKYFVSASYSK